MAEKLVGIVLGSVVVAIIGVIGIALLASLWSSGLAPEQGDTFYELMVTLTNSFVAAI